MKAKSLSMKLKRLLGILAVTILCFGMAACGTEEGNTSGGDVDSKKEENVKQKEEDQEEADKEKEDQEDGGVEEAVEEARVYPTLTFASTGSVPDNPQILMLLVTPENSLLPYIHSTASGKNDDYKVYENVAITSQYFNEDNSLAIESVWAYQYDEDTVITVKTRGTGAAGPNHPRLETDIYVYDVSLEAGFTQILHSCIYDYYDSLNANYVYDFTEREYRTGLGNSIGKQYNVCEEQELLDSLVQYGISITGETVQMVASENQNSPQNFDALVVTVSSPCILSITGRNAELPEEFKNMVNNYN